MKKAISILAVMALLSAASFAQSTTSHPVPVSNNVYPHTWSPFNDQFTNLATPMTLSQWATGQVGDYLGGSVLVDGAGIPAAGITIVISCNGKERYRTTTDVKGNFFVAAYVDSVTKMPRDTPASFVGCEIAADTPGLGSSQLVVHQGAIDDSPNVGTIQLHRIVGMTPTFFSATSAAAPADAVEAYNKALGESKNAMAIEDLQKAVQIYPQYAQAWYTLGKYQQASSAEEAKKSYRQAIAADSNFLLPYIQLTALANQEQKWQEVVINSRHIITLCSKDCPLGWYFNSVGNYHLGRYDVAQKSAEQGLAIDTLHAVPLLEQSMAVILSHNQKFPEAAEHLRSYLKWAPNSAEAPAVRAQLKQVQKTMAEGQSSK